MATRDVQCKLPCDVTATQPCTEPCVVHRWKVPTASRDVVSLAEQRKLDLGSISARYLLPPEVPLKYWSGSERKAVPGALDELARNSSSSPTQLLGRLGQVEKLWRTLRGKLWNATNFILRPKKIPLWSPELQTIF